MDEEKEPEKESRPWEQSDDISELTKAMVAANANFTHPKTNKENEFLKSRYATLSSVIDAYRPAYTDAGLVITQIVTRSLLTTIVAHVSGQFLRFSIEIKPAKDGIQAFGASLTYLRRYTILALTGIAADDDDDDDGQGESSKGKPKAPPTKPPPQKSPPHDALVRESLQKISKTGSSDKAKPEAEKPEGDGPSLLDQILGCKTLEELEGLRPALAELKGAERDKALKLYAEQKKIIEGAAKAVA